MNTTKKLVVTAILIALCVVGANIKIAGSVAFDSLPAFLAALILGPWWGAAIGAVGHLLTAITSGFPLTPLVHILTCLTMALTMVIFYFVKKMCCKKMSLVPALIIAVIVGALINGPVSLLILSPVLMGTLGMGGILGLMPILTLAGAINAAIAAVIYKLLPTSITGNKL